MDQVEMRISVWNHEHGAKTSRQRTKNIMDVFLTRRWKSSITNYSPTCTTWFPKFHDRDHTGQWVQNLLVSNHSMVGL